MSNFFDDNQDDPAAAFVYDDQMLTEVEVDEDDVAPAEDESVAEGEMQEAAEDLPVEYAPDMAFACFSGHSDSVYCAAIHPTLPGVVITGRNSFLCINCSTLDLLVIHFVRFQVVETMLRTSGGTAREMKK